MKRSTTESPVIDIVGGGLQGLFVANELLDAGTSVRIWDQRETGREASWAGGGILSPLYPWRYSVAATRLSVWSQGEYQRVAGELSAVTGINCGWIKSGMLVLGEPDPSALAWASANRVTVEAVDGAKASQLEPAIRANEGGLWLPDIAQIRNPRLLKALKENVLRRGGQIVEQVAVTGFATKSGRLRALETSSGEVPSSAAALTAGAWTGQLLRKTAFTLPIAPVRGQMISFELNPHSLQRIVLDAGFYLIPRGDGLVLVGSTVERTEFDSATTAEARETLKAVAARVVPALRHSPVKAQWAGLRPGSPNDIPYIGAHPQIEGLYVNAGHYRNGIVMAPASARLLADLILGRTPTFDPTPYRLPATP